MCKCIALVLNLFLFFFFYNQFRNCIYGVPRKSEFTGAFNNTFNFMNVFCNYCNEITEYVWKCSFYL